MKNRFDLMDEFIKNRTYVEYEDLIAMNIEPNERWRDISRYFSEWILYFDGKENIKCFNSLDWVYFCQFINNKEEVLSQLEQIKIYVALDSEHIKDGAIQIFEFLTKNNISHVSKISSEVRFDDIVIRLKSKEDAEKLVTFINENSFIKEGMLSANPFAFNQDGIALACDGMLSYNGSLTYFLNKYINEVIVSEERSVDDFHNWLIQQKSQFLESRKNAKTISNGVFRSISGYNYDFNAETATNVLQVLSLLIKATDRNCTIEDYYDHFEECNSPEKTKELMSTLPKYVVLTKEEQNAAFQSMLKIQSYSRLAITILERAIEQTMERYHIGENKEEFIDKVYDKLIQSGDISLITTHNRAREKVEKLFCGKNGKIDLELYEIALMIDIGHDEKVEDEVIYTDRLESILEKINSETVKEESDYRWGYSGGTPDYGEIEKQRTL